MDTEFFDNQKLVSDIFSISIIFFLIIGVPAFFVVNGAFGIDRFYLASYCLAVLFIFLVNIKYGHVLKNKLHLFFYLYFLLLLMATFVSKFLFYDVYSQFITLLNSFIWCSVFISIYFLVITEWQYDIAVKMLDYLGLIIAFSVFLSYIGAQYMNRSFGEVFNDGQQIRAFGFFGDQVGFVLSYFLIRCFAYKKWFGFILYAIAILLTGTRGALISLSFGILLVLFQSFSNKNSRNRLINSIASIIILTSIIATILFSTSYGQNAVDRFVSIFQGEDALHQRRVAIQLGLQIYSDNPILGVGYLGFNRLSQTYNFGRNFAVDTDVNRGTFTTQNQYVQAATDAGTFGLITLVVFLYYLLRELKRQQYKVSDKYSRDMIVAFSWAGAMIFGNQAAVWILPTNITGYLFFLIMGLSLILPKKLLPLV